MTVRLGYACINLALQESDEGYRFRSLTAKRLSSMESREQRAHLYQVARSNLKTLEAVLRWNKRHGIYLFRLTSELIPLATHPVAAQWRWEEDLAYEFSACADVAAKTGIRLTTHPGQYTVLNARDPEIVERSCANLAYHARVLEMLGADTHPDWGMVIHVGGAYGAKPAAAKRFAENFRRLPPAAADRLWVENDDTSWDTEAALEVALEVGRPMVLDIHHHRVLRDDDWRPWLDRILPTWGSIRPKLHFSSPKDGEQSRHHADEIDAREFTAFLERVCGLDLDVMLECKSKDRALLTLRAAIGPAWPE